MTSAIQDQSPTGIKVLLVDDDQEALEELKEIIDLEGWDAVTATDVDEALGELVSHRDISVVVSDFHFVEPNGDHTNGIQFVSRAQAQFAERNLSFVMLSGDPDVLKSSLQVGAFKFLNKPLVPDELVHTVKSAHARSAFESDCSNLGQRSMSI